MAQCFDSEYNRYVYCTSQLTTYIAVGVIIPLIILIIIALVYAYFRCRQRRLRREPQGTFMTTIVPIYNSDEHQHTAYNYPYPPHYASVSEGFFDKPPPYEPTVHQISETNNNNNHSNNSVEDAPAILPATTTTASSAEPIESTRVQN